MSDLTAGLQMVEDMFRGATKGFFGKLDDLTMKMTINGLKSDDFDGICITINQLAKDKKPISIPPLYVVSKAHPNVKVREKASQAIKMIDPHGEVEKLTAGMEVKEAATALIYKYGNFKK